MGADTTDPRKEAHMADTLTLAAQNGRSLGDVIADIKARADAREVADRLQLQRSHEAGKYVCPWCGSGTRPGGDGALQVYVDHFYCFSCHKRGDVLDLVAKMQGIGEGDARAQAVAVCDLMGLRDLEEEARGREICYGWDGKPVRSTTPGAAQTIEAKEERPEGAGAHDYAEGRAKERAYIERAQARIDHPEAVTYLEGRGIDLETARAWGLGYDPEAGGAKDAGGSWCRRGRIVIPWAGSDYYHVDRSIDPGAKNGKYHKPKREDVGPQPLWNPGAVNGDVFFIVEGALDALAVGACGYEAVAAGSNDLSTRNLEAMADALADAQGVAVILLDADVPGREGAGKLAEALTHHGILYLWPDVDTVLGGAKDAGESFATNREGLARGLSMSYAQAVEAAHNQREENYARTLEAGGILDPLDVAFDVYTLKGAEAPISTGLHGIDEALRGGLPARGLVTVGAVSSAGKTTLLLQTGDYIASTGRPVLFCTVEQSAKELALKSISRLMATRKRANGSKIMASTAHIMSAQERESWVGEDPEKMQAFEWACTEYTERIARGEDGMRTLYLMEPHGQPTVGDIRRNAETIAAHDGRPPVVIIDYLQILAAQSERDTDRRSVDRNVMSLRQMARDMSTCVIVISSLNRSSYNGAVTMESFKESGGIEFSSDVLMGLQPLGMYDAVRKAKTDEAAKRIARHILDDWKRMKPERSCEIVVLKNRGNDIPTDLPALMFDGLTCTFRDATESDKRRCMGGENIGWDGDVDITL